MKAVICLLCAVIYITDSTEVKTSISSILEPLVYQVRSEVSHVNQSDSRSIVEYMDDRGKRRSITIIDGGNKTQLIYSYTTSELFFITDSGCKVNKISTSLPQFDDGTGIFLLEKLRIAKKNNMTYVNSIAVRGITCDHWTSYITSIGLYIDWYFSGTDWKTATTFPAVPVRAVVSKTSTTSGQRLTSEFTYDYFEFYPTIKDTPEVFETPVSVYCPGRTKTQPPPKLPPSFHFTLEVVDMADELIQTSEVWYDSTLNIIRFDRTIASAGDPYWIRGPIVELQDYVSGVVYAVNQLMGNCTVLPMGDYMYLTRGLTSNGTYSFPGPEYLLHLDADYTFIGQRMVNGILTDAYQAISNDVIIKYSKTILTIYYSPKVYDDQGADQMKMIPMVLDLATEGVPEIKMYFHGFSTADLKSSELDFSSCWTDDQILTIRMWFPDIIPNLARANPSELSHRLRWYLSDLLSISPLRISEANFHDQTYYKNNSQQPTVQGVYAVLDIYDRVNSIKKFAEIHNPSVHVRERDLVTNIDIKGCADSCEDAQMDTSGMYLDGLGFYCTSFSYCNNTKQCTLYDHDETVNPTNPASNACVYKQRVGMVTGITERKLQNSWSMLKALVVSKSFSLSLTLSPTNTTTYLATMVTEDDSRSFNKTEEYDLSEFSVFQPNTKLNLISETRNKSSVEQCASACTGYPTVQCPIFAMCYTSGLIGQCSIGSYYPDDRPTSYTYGESCTLYTRKYLSWFEPLPGNFPPPVKGNRIMSLPGVEECAKMCYKMDDHNCDIFYFNSDRRECWTSQTLGLDMVDFQGSQAKHLGFKAYVTKYKLYLFDQMVDTQITDKTGAMMSDVTAEDCAATCKRMGYHSCRRFSRTEDGQCRFTSKTTGNTVVDSSSTLYILKSRRSSSSVLTIPTSKQKPPRTTQSPSTGINVIVITAVPKTTDCQTVTVQTPDASRIQFNLYKEDSIVASDEATRAENVNDCMFYCLSENTFQCESIGFCPDSGDCQLSRYHPELNKAILTGKPECQVYSRSYVSEYNQYPGSFVPGNPDEQLTNIPSADICAKRCTEEKGFTCRSFDYCPDTGQCMKWKSHDQEHSSNMKQLDTSCSHYGRNYLIDFKMKANRTFTPDVHYELHLGLTVSQCSKLCVEEEDVTCKSFIVCPGWNQCRLLTVHPKTDSNIRVVGSADCNLYTREYYREVIKPSLPTITSHSSSRSGITPAVTERATQIPVKSGLSTGTVTGIGFGVLVAGILIGLISYHVFKIVKYRRSNDLEMKLINR